MKINTNLGGAISITGTSLIGIGVLTQLAQFSMGTPPNPGLVTVMWYVAIAGFVLSAVGKGVTAYQAADAKVVEKMSTRLEQTIQAVKTGDTEHLVKSDVVNPPTQPPKP